MPLLLALRPTFLPALYAPRQPSPALLCTNPALCAQIACTLRPDPAIIPLHTRAIIQPYTALARPALLCPPPCHTCAPAAARNLRLLHSTPQSRPSVAPSLQPCPCLTCRKKHHIPDKIGIISDWQSKAFFLFHFYFYFIIWVYI
ncbi:hypothetical protein SLEP1_g41682 [Rubroshorea leprosula]|uniref:Uncharacterized protein n=1 Tax=Rubroshorea leprosula TaxID=152421 RepID=A0AAV5L876_9ROSI|nr:hypothetical protein SLEP1_g41682 [Rubroshorea leprosula]